MEKKSDALEGISTTESWSELPVIIFINIIPQIEEHIIQVKLKGTFSV